MYAAILLPILRPSPLAGVNDRFIRAIPFDQPVLLSELASTASIAPLAGQASSAPQSSLAPVQQYPLATGCTDVELVFLDANHCPGAAMVRIRLLPNGPCYLHVGDFRWTDRMCRNPFLREYAATVLDSVRPFSAVYLDTTYCKPCHTFPTQVMQSSHIPPPPPRDGSPVTL